MAGFIRRYQTFPGVEVITAIEGVVIVDLPPPGNINGVGVGTVAIVGEFADMTFATSVDSVGVVSTNPIPVEVLTGQDMLNKVGGFDSTIGDTGISGGNGFIALRNKKFSRLVLVPINLASPLGVRLARFLPTNKSSTNPTPAVPIAAATVAAGREFKSSTNRVRLGARVVFTDTGHYKQGVDGAVTVAGAPAATQLFTAAGGAFTTAKNGGPVQEGDILVVGVIGAAGAQGTNAGAGLNYGNFRVAADASSATQLTVEMIDGINFDWATSGGSLAWRIHPSTDADTGLNHQMSEAAGYTLPARPLDSTIAASITLGPTLSPPVPTASSWDPLSGLLMKTSPTSPGLAYDADVQAPNAVSHAKLTALYSTAIDALLTDDLPARDVNIVVAARHNSDIRTKLKSHVLTASTQGVGRVAVVSPELTTLSIDTVVGDSDPGVGANRNERIFYDWPGALTFIPEAVGFNMKGADGKLYADGNIDTHFDAWMASILSVLAPERNPGQAAPPIPVILAPVKGVQRGVTKLQIGDYTLLRQRGVAALRIDRMVGPIVQSGITSSLISGEKNINRRRMADFLEDSMAQRLVAFSKLPLTPALKDTIVGEMDAFLAGLLSINNPPAQRIAGYIIDDKSGNTPDLEAKGIFVAIAKVRTLATADFIVLQVEAGEGVNVTVK